MIIEKELIKYLNEALDVEAYAEEPEKAPGSYVVIECTGSETDDNFVFTSMIAVQSYGDKMIDAMSLNEKVKQVMYNAVRVDGITSVILNSDYNFTDISKHKYRYQAVFDVTHY